MTKRLASLFLSFIISIAAAHAQDGMYIADPKVFTGGLIFGCNFTQVDGDTFAGYHKVGINTGAVVYVRFSETFGASMELIYTQKGSSASVVSESQSLGEYVERYHMTVNYIEVPITLHYKSHKWDVEGGLSYARLINSKEWAASDQPVYIDPVLNQFNTTDIDYIFGISRQVYKKLYANARFQYSLTSIRQGDRIPLNYGYGNSGQYNNLFSLRLMYMF